MNRSMRIFVNALLLSLTSAAVAQKPSNTIDGSITFSELRANAPVGACDCFWMPGGTGEITYPVWRNFSAIGEVAGHRTGNVPNFNVGLSLVSGMGGLRLRIPTHTRFQPFAQVMFGGVHGFDSYFPAPVGQLPTSSDTSYAMAAGGGLDIAVSRHVWIRALKADYNYSALRNLQGDHQNQLRIGAGIVLRAAKAPQLPVQLSCTAEPANAFPGDPITITASPANLDPRGRAVYSWTSSAGRVSGADATATVTTTGLAPGDYTVTGHVSEGARPGQQASCTTGFHIRAFEPPTITCSANPATLMPGESSTITSVGSSPQNRPLTYSYSASAGQVTGTTATATLSTSNVASGTVTITCNVVDDLGQQATTNTSVTVTAPPTPAAAETRNLCSLSFERDRKRPVRVDNEGKACLDDIALTLNHEPSSRLVIVGQQSSDEPSEAGAERTLNAKQYLTEEKGIDPSRIELRTGEASGRSVENILVPAGATFNAGSTAAFDPQQIKRHGQAYGKPRPMHNNKAH
jgi:hypothetical protein